ncbi:hypothetical protein FB45DRAFT_35439 [Roridomyces roridus]|uniref:Uncharacterized protein n=1 Tax=Roridomyces roridus TaxID=1738132 RepID=A0AAD7G236_9AGAR|nr:hypothetical protein FB45DRAFT_35439 [Roridomyces roridus]
MSAKEGMKEEMCIRKPRGYTADDSFERKSSRYDSSSSSLTRSATVSAPAASPHPAARHPLAEGEQPNVGRGFLPGTRLHGRLKCSKISLIDDREGGEKTYPSKCTLPGTPRPRRALSSPLKLLLLDPPHLQRAHDKPIRPPHRLDMRHPRRIVPSPPGHLALIFDFPVFCGGTSLTRTSSTSPSGSGRFEKRQQGQCCRISRVVYAPRRGCEGSLEVTSAHEKMDEMGEREMKAGQRRRVRWRRRRMRDTERKEDSGEVRGCRIRKREENGGRVG